MAFPFLICLTYVDAVHLKMDLHKRKSYHGHFMGHLIASAVVPHCLSAKLRHFYFIVTGVQSASGTGKAAGANVQIF